MHHDSSFYFLIIVDNKLDDAWYREALLTSLEEKLPRDLAGKQAAYVMHQLG